MHTLPAHSGDDVLARAARRDRELQAGRQQLRCQTSGFRRLLRRRDRVGPLLAARQPGAKMTQPAEMKSINKAIKVLLLEDREMDAEMVIRELRRSGYNPEWKRVQTEPDFLAELNNLPDIILSDYS